jgi:hypothetical protein
MERRKIREEKGQAKRAPTYSSNKYLSQILRCTMRMKK